MKNVKLKPIAIFEPMPRPNQMRNRGASAMRGMALSAIRMGLSSASTVGLVTNTMPTRMPHTLPSRNARMVPSMVQPRSLIRLPVTKISCQRKATMPLGRPIRIGSMSLRAATCSHRRKNTNRIATRPAQI